MRLALERSEVRSWRAADLDSLVRHANNRNIWINLRDRFPSPYTIEDARAWIAFTQNAERMLHLTIAVNHEASGGIGVELEDDVNRRSGEIGYWLGEEHWGKGIATAAVQHDTCARGGKRLGNRAADSFGRASDECRVSAQIKHGIANNHFAAVLASR